MTKRTLEQFATMYANAFIDVCEDGQAETIARIVDGTIRIAAQTNERFSTVKFIKWIEMHVELAYRETDSIGMYNTLVKPSIMWLRSEHGLDK